MDTTTMLEAAHRYVRFFQPQVAALHAMPIVASDSAGSLHVLKRGVDGTGDVEVLSRLSRSQLLQVAVNSSIVQMRNKKSVIRSAMVSASGHYYPATEAELGSLNCTQRLTGAEDFSVCSDMVPKVFL